MEVHALEGTYLGREEWRCAHLLQQESNDEGSEELDAGEEEDISLALCRGAALAHGCTVVVTSAVCVGQVRGHQANGLIVHHARAVVFQGIAGLELAQGWVFALYAEAEST